MFQCQLAFCSRKRERLLHSELADIIVFLDYEREKEILPQQAKLSCHDSRDCAKEILAHPPTETSTQMHFCPETWITEGIVNENGKGRKNKAQVTSGNF